MTPPLLFIYKSTIVGEEGDDDSIAIALGTGKNLFSHIIIISKITANSVPIAKTLSLALLLLSNPATK